MGQQYSVESSNTFEAVDASPGFLFPPLSLLSPLIYHLQYDGRYDDPSLGQASPGLTFAGRMGRRSCLVHHELGIDLNLTRNDVGVRPSETRVGIPSQEGEEGIRGSGMQLDLVGNKSFGGFVQTCEMTLRMLFEATTLLPIALPGGHRVPH